MTTANTNAGYVFLYIYNNGYITCLHPLVIRSPRYLVMLKREEFVYMSSEFV